MKFQKCAQFLVTLMTLILVAPATASAYGRQKPKHDWFISTLRQLQCFRINEAGERASEKPSHERACAQIPRPSLYYPMATEDGHYYCYEYSSVDSSLLNNGEPVDPTQCTQQAQAQWR